MKKMTHLFVVLGLLCSAPVAKAAKFRVEELDENIAAVKDNDGNNTFVDGYEANARSARTLVAQAVAFSTVVRDSLSSDELKAEYDQAKANLKAARSKVLSFGRPGLPGVEGEKRTERDETIETVFSAFKDSYTNDASLFNATNYFAAQMLRKHFNNRIKVGVTDDYDSDAERGGKAAAIATGLAGVARFQYKEGYTNIDEVIKTFEERNSDQAKVLKDIAGWGNRGMALAAGGGLLGSFLLYRIGKKYRVNTWIEKKYSKLRYNLMKGKLDPEADAERLAGIAVDIIDGTMSEDDAVNMFGEHNMPVIMDAVAQVRKEREAHQININITQ